MKRGKKCLAMHYGTSQAHVGGSKKVVEKKFQKKSYFLDIIISLGLACLTTICTLISVIGCRL